MAKTKSDNSYVFMYAALGDQTVLEIWQTALGMAKAKPAAIDSAAVVRRETISLRTTDVDLSTDIGEAVKATKQCKISHKERVPVFLATFNKAAAARDFYQMLASQADVSKQFGRYRGRIDALGISAILQNGEKLQHRPY